MPPRKAVLRDVTREHAFVPGYTGYLPGYHLVTAVSTGEHSDNHLTRKWNAGGKNGQQDLMPSMYYTEMDRAAAERKETMDRRTLELHEHTQGGVPKYSAHVDPKYTGYFPYQLYRFGKRHSVRGREGALEMLQEKVRTCSDQSNPEYCRRGIPEDLALKTVEPIKNPTLDDDYGAYLNNVRSLDNIGDFYVEEVDKSLTLPYRLPPGHRLKRFPWGYTGYLPFTTEFVGVTHGELSKVCLQENDRCRDAADVFRVTPAKMRPIPPKIDDDYNLILHGVPGYTGYKEGTKYRYGYTHAQEMRDVVKMRHPWISESCMVQLTDALHPHVSPMGPRKEVQIGVNAYPRRASTVTPNQDVNAQYFRKS